MYFKNIRTYNLTFKFSKYVTMLIYLVRVVAKAQENFYETKILKKI